MATQKELDAYFGGSPSYELYKKLYGGSGSNAGQINNLYDQQIAQQNAYYDAQLQKLAGQNAQQQQALAAENMRAGRGIRYATTQGGLNNSGIQAQAGVLNAIAGQKAQGTLAAQYQQNVADIEADRAQKAYGLDINRQQALLNDQAQAQQRQATYAGILSGYESQMASEKAAAAQAAAQREAQQAQIDAQKAQVLNADSLIYRDTADLDAFYSELADTASETAQNIINNYGYEAYNNYVSAVQKKLTSAKTSDYNALDTSIKNMSSADAAAYYDSIIKADSEEAQNLINSIGKDNYNKIVKAAKEAAREYKYSDVMSYLDGYFSGAHPERGEAILRYINTVYYPPITNGRIGQYTDVEDAVRTLIKAGFEDFAFITADDLDRILNAAPATPYDPRDDMTDEERRYAAAGVPYPYTSDANKRRGTTVLNGAYTF